MAHFYANIQGNRGEATRMGTAKSGISGHIRGWDIGCYVRCWCDSEGNDHVDISLTGGSNGCGHGKSLGSFTIKDIDD